MHGFAFTPRHSPHPQQLDRIKTLTGTGGSCTGLTWSYDVWGNRTNQTVTGGSCTMSSLGFNAKNQINNSGFGYDAAGNLTAEPGRSYQYDAENRMTSVNGGSTATYSYGPNGERVRKLAGGAPTYYFRDLGGQVLTELADNNVWTVGYVYLNGQLLAQYKDSTTYFAHKDHLGSTRLLTRVNQTIHANYDYLPFGEESGGSGGTATTHKFTGQERDAETGLDYFIARHYASSHGRFLQSDPIGGHREDPQTLNRYTYVRNNPLNLTDPTGLDFYLSCEKESNTCGKNEAGSLVQGEYVTDGEGNKTFQPTVVTSASLQDPESGNTATVNENGVQITTANGTTQGIFINGTPAADIQGSGKLSDFAFHIDSSDEKKGTLAAGTYTYGGSRDQAEVVKVLRGRGSFQYTVEKVFGNPFHKGYLNFRFSSGKHPDLFDYGPSPHLLVLKDPKATVPAGPGYVGPFHVDSHTGGARHGGCAMLRIGCR